VSNVDNLLAADYPTAEVELPRAEDNIERVVRYSLIGRPDFVFDFGGERTWAPWDLTIIYRRHTAYRGGQVVERSDWRPTNVELHGWLRLKSGKTSDRVDVLIEFDDLPHDYRLRHFREKEATYRKAKAADFPYVAEMVAASTPEPGELV